MRDKRLAPRLLRATPALIMALVVVPILGWLLSEGGLRRLLDVVALGVFAYILLVALVSDHAVSKVSRRLLTRSLDRPVVPGEETSLTTWMRMDSTKLAAASDELRRLRF